ncbi:aromatic-L-amino-acid decarboxylase-like [Aricia agestis]|uniref:aromatic-L-amino-acid decarboxylase-like n=1 Tax=Aricia agestis TaxID=91739 RepID=UPI001C20BA2F|nr:aromatic-L-amino-acid decarboxylase-like [Aricia agestis]
METEQFRQFGKTAIDIIADYYINIRERDVLPSVLPEDFIRLMPENAPESPEKWQELLEDFQKKVIPAITHWHSPQFHSYFPVGVSLASIVGSLLCSGLGIKGSTWISSPACTELEVVVVSWLAKMLGLPEYFQNTAAGPGGGVIQGSASESTLVCLLAAKHRMLREMKASNKEIDEDRIKTKFVIYTSDQSNSSVEKSGVLGSMITRLLKTDNNGQLRGETLKKAFENDKSKGLIPCYVVASYGTTGTCAFDPIDEIGPICREEGVWLHIDAAYAGTAFVCPEYRHLMKGIEYVDSFVFNPHKWMLVNYDCSVLYVKDCFDLIKTFDVKGDIDVNDEKETVFPQYRYWQIPCSRRFRALKLWIVLKIYGASGVRDLVRTQVNLANHFASLVRGDSRLVIEPEPSMTVVCFRLRKGDFLTEKLLEYLVNQKKIFMVAAIFRNHYVIRMVICSQFTTKDDVDRSWNTIQDGVNYVLSHSHRFNHRKSLLTNRRLSLDIERV